MSNLIFPDLLGCRAITVGREPIEKVDVHETVSDREQRDLWTFAPRYRLQVKLNFLRSAETFRELQALAGFYARHRGPYDSFLFKDPEDSVVADHGFGVGDGSRTAFQLQRTLLGDVEDVLGKWSTYTKPRTNKVVNSQASASWSKLGGGTGVAALAWDAAGEAPNGAPTAIRVLLDKGAGSTSSDSSYVTLGPNPLIGDTATGSIWMRTFDGSTVTVAIRIGQAIQQCVVTPQWQRYSTTRSNPYDSDLTGFGVWLRGNYSTSSRADLLVWGPQSESGLEATRHVATAGAAVREDPAYWPAIGDGFEPVWEPGPDLALYVEGDGLGRRPLARVARTNLALRSEQIDDAAWTKYSATITANAVPAPDGAATGDRIVCTTAASTIHGIGRSATCAKDRRYVFSAYVKADTATYCFIIFANAAFASQPLVEFNLGTGVATVRGGSPLAYGLEPVGGGWFRVWMAATAAAAGTGDYYLQLGDATGQRIFTGAGTEALFAWGMQFEEGASPGDYIVTTTAAASRTDAVLGAAGAVTLAAAPRAGAALSWSGSFWRRCRFADRLPVERFLAQVWRTGSVELVEVKP